MFSEIRTYAISPSDVFHGRKRVVRILLPCCSVKHLSNRCARERSHTAFNFFWCNADSPWTQIVAFRRWHWCWVVTRAFYIYQLKWLDCISILLEGFACLYFKGEEKCVNSLKEHSFYVEESVHRKISRANNEQPFNDRLTTFFPICRNLNKLMK